MVMARGSRVTSSRLVVLGASVSKPTDVFVLFNARRSRAWKPLTSLGAIWYAANAGRKVVTNLLERARTESDVVCFATATGTGREPRTGAREQIETRVLPALERHFASMTTTTEDVSPWLLQVVIAQTISMRVDGQTLERYLCAIDAALGRGDETITSQLLTAASNLVFYARRTSKAAADRVLARWPVLDGLRKLDDPRLWADGVPRLTGASARHARAAAQIGIRAIEHHDTTPEWALAVAKLVLGVPGVTKLGAELDVRRAVRARSDDFRSDGLDTTALQRIGG